MQDLLQELRNSNSSKILTEASDAFLYPSFLIKYVSSMLPQYIIKYVRAYGKAMQTSPEAARPLVFPDLRELFILSAALALFSYVWCSIN